MFSDLAKRVIELSYRHQLTHVSSALNCVDLIDEIYGQREDHEPFVLGNSHAALALYVVLENRGKCDAEKMIDIHGTHAGRDMEHGIWVSGGSLGQAETIAIGLALADRKRKVWLVTSDGACMEGAIWEAARYARQRDLHNLKAFIVFNGFGAYQKIAGSDLPNGFGWNVREVDTSKWPGWLRGLPGHYLKLSEEQYTELMS